MKRFCIVCIDVGKYNNIMRFFSILLQYKEIIGTLLGTTLGWMLNSFSRHGKLIIYAVWEDKFQKNNNYGSMEDSSIDEAQYYHYELCLDLYNIHKQQLLPANIFDELTEAGHLLHIPKLIFSYSITPHRCFYHISIC